MRAIRVAVIWLLAFALPLQGAVAGMLACAATHGVAAADLGHAHHAQDAGHLDARAAAHSHAPDALADPPDGASHHGDAGVTHGDADPTAAACSGCSLCASCCTAAVLPAAVQPLDTPVFAQAGATPSVTRIARFVPGGLERPPRHPCA
jgi:hypothetical protein